MSIYPSVCGGYGIRGDKGDPGEDGTVLNSWRGQWEPNLVYMPGDLVGYEGSVYILNVAPSVPNVYAVTYTPEPPAAPWELFVQGSALPHWLGITSELLGAASGQNYLLNLDGIDEGSDVDWYAVDAERVVVPNGGLYKVSAALRMSLPSDPDPSVPTLRNFQISVDAQPVAAETAWTFGRSWGTTVTSPTLRLGDHAEVRFLVRQDSGLEASVSANLSVTYAGS